MAISVEAFLAVPGDPVVVVEHDRGGDGLPFWPRLEAMAPWLRVERRVDGTYPRRTELVGTRPHGPISLVGDLEGRMLEPLVETLRALATGEVDWETPATPSLLRKMDSRRLMVVVAPSCPFCPRVAAIALRFASASTRLATDIVRVDSGAAPEGIRSVPSVLVAGRLVATGSLGEYGLAEQILNLPSRAS